MKNGLGALCVFVVTFFREICGSGLLFGFQFHRYRAVVDDFDLHG